MRRQTNTRDLKIQHHLCCLFLVNYVEMVLYLSCHCLVTVLKASHICHIISHCCLVPQKILSLIYLSLIQFCLEIISLWHFFISLGSGIYLICIFILSHILCDCILFLPQIYLNWQKLYLQFILFKKKNILIFTCLVLVSSCFNLVIC